MNEGRLREIAALIVTGLALMFDLSFVSLARAAAVGVSSDVSRPSAERPLSLADVLEAASRTYPSLESASAREAAAVGGVELARIAYWPRADLQAQINRATDNNTTGLLFPQGAILPISGPVTDPPSAANVWGSAVGLIVSWQFFDFGLRAAQVDAARAEAVQAQAASQLTRLQVVTGAASAYMDVVAAEQVVHAAEAAVGRARVLVTSVERLTKSGMRPGADLSRARAELAAAQIQLDRALQSLVSSRAGLSRWIGHPVDGAVVAEPAFDRLPPDDGARAAALAAHPAARSQAASLAAAKAREVILDRSYFPRFDLEGAVYGRGSGASAGAAPAEGLLPVRPNAAAGVTAALPLFDVVSLGIKQRIEHANERAEAARYEEVLRSLEESYARAQADYAGAGRIAGETPIELDAARAGELQERTRYQTGLATVLEVADAERVLAQAEIDDALAKLQVWRALLTVCAARGDLRPFLALVGAAEGGE